MEGDLPSKTTYDAETLKLAVRMPKIHLCSSVCLTRSCRQPLISRICVHQ